MLLGREIRFSFEKVNLPPSNILVFDSRSEYACAVLMERFIPGWEARMGETFQFPVDTKRIDFRVEDTFIEFHPIRISKKKSSPVFERIEAEAKNIYYQRRRDLLDDNGFKNYPLICAYNEREFYSKVMQRFGQKLPSINDFLAEFQKLRFILES